MDDTIDIIRKADAKAEGLLGLVRIAIATVLGIALVLAVNSSGRPESAVLDKQIAIASIIIASYFLVGVGTSLIVWLGRYKLWMAWVTAFFDIALISGNIWLSLANAGISSLYALSFPSALMVPLILTFGALRFRPSIQMTMTLLAGLFLVLIIFSNPDLPQANEHILAHFTTTYGVPPNLIRTLMIVSTGSVIALAAWRARRLLERIAAEVEQRTNLTRFLPSGVTENTSDDAMQRLRAGKHATLAIMFVDIRNFTRMAERMSPESASRLLGDYRSNILDVVDAHGGMVDKFIGDGALILFGLTQTPKEAASQSVLAATKLLERMAKWNIRRSTRHKPTIAIGIGLHLGSVVVGAIGDERRLEFTVIGDEVNVAARVEQATKSTSFSLLATTTIIDEAVTISDEDWEDLGNIALRGRESPVHLWGYTLPTLGES